MMATYQRTGMDETTREDVSSGKQENKQLPLLFAFDDGIGTIVFYLNVNTIYWGIYIPCNIEHL